MPNKAIILGGALHSTWMRVTRPGKGRQFRLILRKGVSFAQIRNKISTCKQVCGVRLSHCLHSQYHYPYAHLGTGPQIKTMANV